MTPKLVEYEVPAHPPGWGENTTSARSVATFDALATAGSIVHFSPRRIGSTEPDPHTSIAIVAADRAGERAVGLSLDGRLNFFDEGSVETVPQARGYARFSAHAESHVLAGSKTLKVRDARTRKECTSIKVPKECTGLAAAPGAACVAWQGVVARFDLATGEETARFDCPRKTDAIEHLVVSDDGRSLATGGGGFTGPLRLFDEAMVVRAERPASDAWARLVPLRFGDGCLYALDGVGRIVALSLPTLADARVVADLAEARFGCTEPPAIDFSQRPPHYIHRAAISADGRVLSCTRRVDDTVDRFDLTTGARETAVFPNGVTSIVVSVSGEHTWIASDHVYRWSLPPVG